jgi:hypothetical protein
VGGQCTQRLCVVRLAMVSLTLRPLCDYADARAVQLKCELLDVSFIAIRGSARRDGGGFVCEDGMISRDFTGMREGPTIKMEAET